MKLVLPLDNEIFFDAAEPTTAMADKEEFLRYMKSTSNVSLSREEIKKGLCAISRFQSQPLVYLHKV